jgi:hypothetical protein
LTWGFGEITVYGEKGRKGEGEKGYGSGYGKEESRGREGDNGMRQGV